MTGVLMTAMMFLLAAPARPKPAAMVLELKGPVELRPPDGQATRARLGDLLYPGERVVVPAGGTVTLSILGAGAQETLRSGSEAVVGAEGCAPPGSVESRKTQIKAVATTMKNLRPAAGNTRQAGVSFRSGAEEPRPITPIFGATVVTDRPGLAWPPGEKVATYRVRLISGAGRELWRAQTQEPRLAFPEDKEALKPGYVYRWEVTDPDYRPLASGEFTVATEAERRQLEELKALAQEGDPADRLAAALAYRRLAAYAEAVMAYERLAAESPGEAAYRSALADLYRLIGRAEPAGSPR